MTITIQAVPSINAPTGVVMTGAGDQFWLLDRIVLASESFIGVHMTGGGAVVTIDGTVQTLLSAVRTDGATSRVTIGVEGVVRSSGSSGPCVYLNSWFNRMTNEGLINSVSDIGVYMSGFGSSLENTGRIVAGMAGVFVDNTIVGGGGIPSQLVNQGTISGGFGFTSQLEHKTGVTLAIISSVVNHGTISSVADIGAGILVGFSGKPAGGSSVTNHGTVSSVRDWGIQGEGAVGGASGVAIVNTGLISGALGSILGSALTDTVTNSGTLSGDVSLADGDDRLDNAGQVLGDVVLGSGNDTYDGRLGSATGGVFGDDGFDVLVGGNAADDMAGGNGNDTLRGGDGDDSLMGEVGNDALNGGRGDDALRGGQGFDGLSGGAGDDTITGDDDNDLIYGGGDEDHLSGGNGLDTVFGGTGDDTLTGGAQADRLVGGNGDDSLDGGTENDTLEGGGGGDTLLGGGQNDILRGGSGADVLTGGFGRDTMTGGVDADIFVFATAGECGVGASRDTLTDFATGVDKLDLSAIQAGMTFIGGANFGNIAGQVRYVQATGLLSGDTDGNGTTDFNLQFAAGTVVLAGDLIL